MKKKKKKDITGQNFRWITSNYEIPELTNMYMQS